MLPAGIVLRQEKRRKHDQENESCFSNQWGAKLCLLGASVNRVSKGFLNPLVLLSACSDWRSGIPFPPQPAPNASIESARPMGRNPHHSPESSDW